METHRAEASTINNNQHNEGKRDAIQVQLKQQEVQLLNPAPSSTSSPSHEFSFTISQQTTKTPNNNNNNKIKSSSSPPSFSAVDLSPADEIFFHGHLLPLHFLRPPIDFSSDTFTLPIKELSHHENNNYINIDEDDYRKFESSRHVAEGKGRGKSRSFSLFPKRRENKSFDEKDDDHKPKRKSRFNVVKNYMRSVKLPFLFGNKKKGGKFEFLSRRPFSYSEVIRKNKCSMRGEFSSSAPVSMINSPNNSGVLVASGNLTPNYKNDSTMEELQAAIQAAIAHCKKSIHGEANKEQEEGITACYF